MSLQGTDLALSRSVVGDVDSVELGLGDVTELLGPDLDSLGASRPITVALARMDALELIPRGGELLYPFSVLILRGEVSLEVRTVALDPVVNGLLAHVCRQELTKLSGDLLLAGDA